ncbi:MAG: transporter substrate-binding domain-containing protein [Oscillospiraceae bacterium]|nr:transporter substrate-binding domain-containing protein [Oscillospiraceae bacterium]
MRKTIKAGISIALLTAIALFTLASCGPSNVVFSVDDVYGSVIGGLAGTPSYRLATEYGTARAYYSAEQMMVDLRAGLLDCVIMEGSTAAELVSGTSGVRVLYEPLVEYDLCFAVPKENTRLLTAVNDALGTLNRNGTLRGLYNKYFAGRSYTYTSTPPDEPRTATLIVALPPDSPPFSYKDDEGRFVGMDVEMAVAVGDILGVDIRVLEYDSWELAVAVWHGKADLALGWHPGEGEGIVNMSEPYATVIQSIIVRR